MTITPIFDLTVDSEKNDALSRLNIYPLFTDSSYNTIPYTNLQILINEASENIYSYTRYWPKVEDAELTVSLNQNGQGVLKYKLPCNLDDISSSDVNFDTFLFDTDLPRLHRNGKFELNQFCVDNEGFRVYPIDVVLTLDYGFIKSTQMPEKFKNVCIEIVIHNISNTVNDAGRELVYQKMGDVSQGYRNPGVVIDVILQKLRGFKI